VGDIHGRADLLASAWSDRRAYRRHILDDPHLVFVGDYVDHGPESAETLARMRELTRDFPTSVTCLMGNHERMMLDFLTDPVTRGPRWLREGGAATLWSFRIDPEPLQTSGKAEDFREAATPRRRDAGGAARLAGVLAAQLAVRQPLGRACRRGPRPSDGRAIDPRASVGSPGVRGRPPRRWHMGRPWPY
jgi:hypothetical protein